MSLYEDIVFETLSQDDSQIVTCRMCHEDCELSCFSDGLCPGCASLCASAPPAADEDDYRRSHLVNLTRRAFVLWCEAADLFNRRHTAIRPSASCIEEAAQLAQHRLRKYNLLESRLADETGLDKTSVYNLICRYPDCARLMTAGL